MGILTDEKALGMLALTARDLAAIAKAYGVTKEGVAYLDASIRVSNLYLTLTGQDPIDVESNDLIQHQRNGMWVYGIPDEIAHRTHQIKE